MKHLIFITIMMISLNLFAANVEDADKLFANRGDDVTNALEASKIYGELANDSRDNAIKALMLLRQSESAYYVGTNTGGYWPIEMKGISETPKELKKKRKVIHDKAVTDIKNAMKLFPTLTDQTLKAQIMYMYGSNLGKWGENNGPLSSLAKWPELKRKMLEIIKMKQAAIANFGAFRVLGRAYYKLPKIGGGSKKKSYQYLKKSFDGSLNSDGACTHGLNVLYFAETLIAMKKKDQARTILQKFIAADYITLNLNRIPETKGEQEFAVKLLNTF